MALGPPTQAQACIRNTPEHLAFRALCVGLPPRTISDNIVFSRHLAAEPPTFEAGWDIFRPHAVMESQALARAAHVAQRYARTERNTLNVWPSSNFEHLGSDNSVSKLHLAAEAPAFAAGWNILRPHAAIGSQAACRLVHVVPRTSRCET